jgi:hypothetical protein
MRGGLVSTDSELGLGAVACEHGNDKPESQKKAVNFVTRLATATSPRSEVIIQKISRGFMRNDFWSVFLSNLLLLTY